MANTRSGAFTRPTLRTAWRYPAVVAGGLLLHLAFPPRTVWWTAILAFALLWPALQDVRARHAAGLGWLFGMAFFTPQLAWIGEFLGDEYGPFPWLGLAALMAAYIGAVCALVPLVARLPGAAFWGAALVVVSESVRGRFPINGFPWGRVAFGQADGPFASFAAVGGAALVTFAVAATGFCLASMALHPATLRRPLPALLIVAGLLLAPLARVEPAPDAGERTIAVAQGNVPDIGLGLFGETDTIRANQLRVTRELADGIRAGEQPRPDLFVWPEGSVTTVPDDPAIDGVVADVGVPALIGGARSDLVDGTDLRTNSVTVWDPATGPGEHYAKQELVPFGERVPFREISRYLTPFTALQDFDAGTRPGVLDVTGVRLGVAICYEVAYDWVLRESAAQGGELFVLPTHNAWYGRGEMTYQQLGMARLRAVEHGRAVAVAALGGVSAMIAPDGTVLDSTGRYTEDVLTAALPLSTGTTLATRIGGYVEWLLVLAGVAACGVGLLRRRRATT